MKLLARRCAAVLSVVVALGALSQLEAADPRNLKRAASLCKRGETALQRGQLEKAETAFTEALEEVPAYPDGHLGLGHIAGSQGRHEDALSHFEAAKEGYASLGESLVEIRMKRYGLVQRQIQELRDTISTIQSQSSGRSDNLQISQMENQIARLESVDAPNRDEASTEAPGEVFFHIGNAHFQMGNVEAAIHAWRTCSDRSPKFAMVHNNLALALGRQGRFDEALAHLASAEELGFPVNPDFKRDLNAAAAGR